MMQWRRACELDTYLANRSRLQRLAFYSRSRLHQLTETCSSNTTAAPATWC
jgi:D-amino-acid dehydrogenase